MLNVGYSKYIFKIIFINIYIFDFIMYIFYLRSKKHLYCLFKA